ncbi:MAG: VOC family protein [Bacteroidota bacterium]|nr:VOC family protein [Bacteroidota bacterium]
MNTVSYFEIQSSNPQREIDFYRNIFGWKFIKQELAPIEYYRIETPGVSGGLLKRPAPVPPQGTGTNAFVCSAQVENFDKTGTLITQEGGQVAMPKFAVPGRCWQGYFIDPDGNTFGIFEVDENAR